MSDKFSVKGHPVGALLPRYTFITGPNGVGKTTLGSQLFSNINGLQLYSFAEPLRTALVGMFYAGDITIDLTREDMKSLPVPGFPKITHREALNALGDWAKKFFDPYFIGEFAKHRCLIDSQYFEQFVFDDARIAEDVEPILTDCGKQDALLISLSRPGVTYSQANHYRHDDLVHEFRFHGLRVVELVNDGNIADLLPKLQTTLEQENVIIASGVLPNQL